MHSRSFNSLVVWVVLASFLASLMAPVNWGVAAPIVPPAPGPAQNQTDEGTPPLIEPVDGSTPQDAVQDVLEDASGAEGEESPEGLLPITIGDNLGNGAQPEGLPREIGVGDARFLFDRLVPLNAESLVRIAENPELVVYAASEAAPFDAVYVTSVGGATALARYLPERLDAPDMACPAEAVNIGTLDANGTLYIFAGLEFDLSVDALQEVGESNGQPLYIDPTAGEPFPEIFVADANGLLRFVITAGDGRPASLADSLAFAGTLFSFVADVTDQIDPASLTKVGCAGPYPVYADQEDATAANRYVRAGGRLFQFSGEGAPLDAPTEVPTEIPVVEPTAVPTEIPPTEVPPTEVPPTEVPPTEIPPTEVPTDGLTAQATEVPADVPAVPADNATEEPTEVPADAATEEPTVPTEVPAGATAATPGLPADIAEAAAAYGLPPQVEVQNTSYVFTQIDVDIDIEALVEIDVVTVNDLELTIYAEKAFTGVAPVLFCVADDGAVIGRYVPAAATAPTPPAELPATIDVENTTYVFNQVNVDIDIQTLVEVNVIVVQNVELTIYADQNVDGQPSRFFAVAANGQVVGQYVESSLVVTTTQVTPQPTAQLQPPAVVATQAPDAPPPAAVTAEPADTCAGSPGPINDQGIPAYLPNRIQLGGIAYALVGPESPGDAGELTRIGCISGFEILTTDQADRSEVIYLRIAGQGSAADAVYRFEAAVTFNVEFEVTGRPQRITTTEQQFRLIDTWLPSIYSSTTVILFVENAETALPDVFYAVNVYNTVVGEVVGEYRQAEQNAQPSDEIVAAAEAAGINPDLTVDGQRYLLVNVYSPVGTTTNGFVTL
nr:hypothetical protein [Chloroflexia bacterium]